MGKITDFECHSCNMEWCVDIEPKYGEADMPDEFKQVDVDFDECPNCGSENIKRIG